MPKVPDNLLPALDVAPLSTINNTTEKKMQRKIEHIRGPETIHNTFLYGQYGIIVSSESIELSNRFLLIVSLVLFHSGAERLSTASRSSESNSSHGERLAEQANVRSLAYSGALEIGYQKGETAGEAQSIENSDLTKCNLLILFFLSFQTGRR